MKVKKLMQTSVATVRGNDTLTAVDDLMKTGWVRHLPVVDATDRLLGVITQRDVLKASMSSMAGADPVAHQRWLEQVRVRDVMTKKPITIGPEADLSEVVDKLLLGKFGCLPVVEQGELVGLITETDLLRYLQTLLKVKRSSSRSSTQTAKKKPAAVK
ncbi:MAG: CBS domain-containing protein [Candidatus Binatia bacterium]